MSAEDKDAPKGEDVTEETPEVTPEPVAEESTPEPEPEVAEPVAEAEETPEVEADEDDAPAAEADEADAAPEAESDETPEADAEDEADEEDAEPEADPAEEAAQERSRRLRRRRKAAGAPDSTPAAAPTRRRTKRDPSAPIPVVRAQAKYVRSSARKARLVCDNIRGKSVDEARAILAHTPRAIARDWSKLLESAVANAEHNHELVGEDLYVKAISADEGPTIKRFQPRAMGRATKIRKRTSHLTISLTPKD
jgi:ribosomal protein L22